jgi:predicted dehydrogenase
MLQKFQPNNLRIGFIGLGDHAFEQLLPPLKITSGMELSAISSRSQEKLELFGNKFQPQYTTQNWQDLIDPKNFDGVIVSAPPSVHYQVAKACLENGLHCFIEKPPTQNLSQLQELLKIKQNSNQSPDSQVSQVFVGYNFSYSQAYQKMLKILKKAPIKHGRFRFLTAKPTSPCDGFETVLESGLYKMFIHPMHTLLQTFGKVKSFHILNTQFYPEIYNTSFISSKSNPQILEKQNTADDTENSETRFLMTVAFEFEDNGSTILEWGNVSNRFECRFELMNELCQSVVLDNMGKYEIWNLPEYDFLEEKFLEEENLKNDEFESENKTERGVENKTKTGSTFSKITKNKERLIFENSPLMGGFERTGYQVELEFWRDSILGKKKCTGLEDSLEIYLIIKEILGRVGL